MSLGLIIGYICYPLLEVKTVRVALSTKIKYISTEHYCPIKRSLNIPSPFSLLKQICLTLKTDKHRETHIVWKCLFYSFYGIIKTFFNPNYKKNSLIVHDFFCYNLRKGKNWLNRVWSKRGMFIVDNLDLINYFLRMRKSLWSPS